MTINAFIGAKIGTCFSVFLLSATPSLNAQQPAKLYLAETVFIFHATEEIKNDSTTIAGFARAVNGLLKETYQRPVLKSDIRISTATNGAKPAILFLTLRGKFDTVKVVQALSRKTNPSDFELLKGAAVASVQVQLANAQKKGNRFPLQVFQNSAYGTKGETGKVATFLLKDTIVVKKLLLQVKAPKGEKFCFANERADRPGNASATLCLVHKEPLINAYELSDAFLEFDESGYPGVVSVLTQKGKAKLANYSQQNVGSTLAISVKGEIVATPVITSEIPNGLLFLSGGITVQYARHVLDKIGYPMPFYFVSIKDRQR